MTKPPARLMAENVAFTLGATAEAPNGFPIIAQIGRTERGEVVELAICESGKLGHGLQLLLSELSIKISRALQGRNPETGEAA